MNIFCGEHLSDDTTKETSILNEQTQSSQRRLERQIPIDIVLQSSHTSPYPHTSHTRTIGSSLPWLPLKAAAPKLIDHLTPCATSLVFPSSPALDAHLLVNFLALIISQHETGSAPALDLASLPPDPVSLIKLHIILELLGLERLAGGVLEWLWTAFAEGPVTLEHVVWILGSMGEERMGWGRREWVPRSRELYVQMMAWGVLNADWEGRLDEQLRVFLVREEGRRS
ncbi:hypothetical protein E8E13_002508 [Curvularia kusanoi]|uniref:Uncharacterized protein n=1 Tax=Curvularia kusanoi TaxID=90978 RepID=A0A9P4TFH0_CURKU|nr:hypothetical protein E8E13_002508 [Curvularia kusanoi]